MLFEVAYIANLSKKQPSSILPINQIRLEMMQARSGQAQRPFTQFLKRVDYCAEHWGFELSRVGSAGGEAIFKGL